MATNSSKFYLTATAANKTLNTPDSTSGIHILWDVVDTSTGAIVSDVTAISLNFYVVLPNGRLDAFDVGTVAASSFGIDPTAIGGGTPIKVVATGLTGTIAVLMVIRGLY